MLSIQRCVLLMFAILTGASAPAQAQWGVTPYLGVNLAGGAEFRRGGPGVSITYFGSRLGFEFGVERYNHFYKDEDVAGLVANNCGVGPGGAPCTDLNTDALGYGGNCRGAAAHRRKLASVRHRRSGRHSRVADRSVEHGREHHSEQPRDQLRGWCDLFVPHPRLVAG